MNPCEVPEEAKYGRPDCILVSMGPPQGVGDEECGTAQMLISDPEYLMTGFYGKRQYAYFRPTEEDLKNLNNGGFIEFCQYGSVVQPFSAATWAPAPTEVADEVLDAVKKENPDEVAQ